VDLEVVGKTEGAKCFDFLHGEWRVAHRRLNERLKGARDWTEFEGQVRVRPILSGLGNFDENVIELPTGVYEACTLRLFDPQSQNWSIYWIDGRNPKLDPPLVGRFTGTNGVFFGDDQHEGRPIRVRFTWTRSGENACHWEQAFSDDNGVQWETNWTMEFER
jgi:hypothetical protein